MKVHLLHSSCIFLLTLIVSCSTNSNQPNIQLKDTAQKTAQVPNDTIISGHSYYLRSPLSETLKHSWKRVVVDTVNDEFDNWIEVKLDYSDKEWIKIEAESKENALISSIETNSNYFLHESQIKIGDEVSPLILSDSAQFNFDEGKLILSIGAYEIKAHCLAEISDIEFDMILEAREVRRKDLLPAKIKTCRVSSVRVVNVK